MTTPIVIAGDLYAEHKKEIEVLSREIKKLANQIRELTNKQSGDDSDKENVTPKKQRKPTATTVEWKPGLKFNHKWDRAKKADFNRFFREKYPEGFKKVMLVRLERQVTAKKKALAGE